MRVCYLVKFLCLFSIIVCIYGNIVVMSSRNARIECGLGVMFPAWDKDGSVITISGNPTVNTGSFPRLSYDSDNKTLILTGALSSDDGVYTCSLSGSSDSTTVSVLTFNPPSWPGENGGFCSISTVCQTTGATVKWSYIFITKGGEKKEYKSVETTTNTTGCSPDKEQLIIGFTLTHNDDFGCLKVELTYDLLHNTTGDTSQGSGTSDLTYCVLGCCAIAAVFDYLFFATAVLALLITAVLCGIYRKQLGKMLFTIIIVLAVILLAAAIAWFIPLCTEVLPVLPDGDRLDECSCGHPIAFVLIMVLWTCIGVAMISYIIYREKKEKDGEAEIEIPLLTCMTACVEQISPTCSSDNTGEETENRQKKVQDTGSETHTNEPRPQPKPTKEKRKKKNKNKRPPADLDEPPQGKPVLPGIKDKPRTDPQKTPRPLPPIKKGQD